MTTQNVSFFSVKMQYLRHTDAKQKQVQLCILTASKLMFLHKSRQVTPSVEASLFSQCSTSSGARQLWEVDEFCRSASVLRKEVLPWIPSLIKQDL